MNEAEMLDLIAEQADALQTIRELRVDDLRRIQELEDELERHARKVMAI